MNQRCRAVCTTISKALIAGAVVLVLGACGNGPQSVASGSSSGAPSAARPAAEVPSGAVAGADDQTKAQPLGRLGFSTRVDQLPAGLQIADEAEAGGVAGRPTYAVLSLSPDGSRVMHGDGPYLRFTAGRDPAGERNIDVHIEQGARQINVQGAKGVVLHGEDPQTLDVPDQMKRLAPWVSVFWIDGAGNSVGIQGRGVDTETLIEIAEGTHYAR